KTLTSHAWAVTDSTGAGYSINSGTDDGKADEFGRADAWALAYHPDELDDSDATNSAPAEIGSFVNGETTDNSDVVVWYAANFDHSPGEPDSRHNKKLGPVLKPLRLRAGTDISDYR